MEGASRMIIPAAESIEAGLDALAKIDPTVIARELKEFHVANAVGVLSIDFPDGTPDVAKGYLLALETVRFMFASGTFLSGETL
jgi:hypothetical protein